jgi:DNA primase
MERQPFITATMLSKIRVNADWRALFPALGLEKDETKSKPDDWWAKSPFNPNERHASFHINDKGFCCFSSGETGGTVELVQRVLASRGELLNCFEAGRWMVEHGVSHCDTIQNGKSHAPKPALHETSSAGASGEEKRKPNEPIRQNLVPLLTQQGTHPEFVRRGISEETCRYLRCGVLEAGKSSLAGRIVFQIRGVRPDPDGALKSVILSHMGRALTQEQEDAHGKWLLYGGFSKIQEIYNIDRVLIDADARKQLQDSGHVILVEGAFDVAALVEAGIKNVVASFGAHLAKEQLPVLDLIAQETGVRRVLIWYDRGTVDPAGAKGATGAAELLASAGFQSVPFDWEMAIYSPTRGEVRIPAKITDPGDFSKIQLHWLRQQQMI